MILRLGGGVGGEDVIADEDRPACTGPSGIGGWLILPLLGIMVTPIVWAVGLTDYTGIWDAMPFLTVPQKAFLILESVAGFALTVAAASLLLYLMYKKLEIFPGLYIIWLWALPGFVILDALLFFWIFDNFVSFEDVFDRETKRSITRGIGQAILWTAYMYKSVRVENTFVN